MLIGNFDQAIYQRLLRRDPSAAALLMDRYGCLLQRCILGFLGIGREEDIEEVLNDTLHTVWSEIDEYDPDRASFKTWVFMRARYCALARRRKLLKESSQISSLPPADLNHLDPDVALRIDLSVAFMRLDDLDRQILYLCDCVGMDRQEVASKLGMKRGALNTRIHRIRKRLQRVLGEWRLEGKKTR